MSDAFLYRAYSSHSSELRVFISSTYRDLQEEREHLVKILVGRRYGCTTNSTRKPRSTSTSCGSRRSPFVPDERTTGGGVAERRFEHLGALPGSTYPTGSPTSIAGPTVTPFFRGGSAIVSSTAPGRCSFEK